MAWEDEASVSGPEIYVGGESSAEQKPAKAESSSIYSKNNGLSAQDNPYIKILQEKTADNSLDDFYIQRKKYLASRLVPEARELYGEENFASMSRELEQLEAAYSYFISSGGMAAGEPAEYSGISGAENIADRIYNKKTETAVNPSRHTRQTGVKPESKKNNAARQEYSSSGPAPFWNIWKVLTLLVVLSACVYAYNEVRLYMAAKNGADRTYSIAQEEDYIPEIHKDNADSEQPYAERQAEENKISDKYAGEQGIAAAAAVKKFEKRSHGRKFPVSSNGHIPARMPAVSAPHGSFGADKQNGADMRTMLESAHNKKRHSDSKSDSKSEINLISAKVVSFGRYPQNSRGAVKPLEWIVLDVKKNGEALLLSRYVLEAAPFSQKQLPASWQESYIRKWLNSDFLNKAFNPDEQKTIVYSFIPNKPAEIHFSAEDASYWSKMLSADLSSAGNTVWSTEGFPQTRDRVFLLSYQEAVNYLSRGYMAAKATDYSLTPSGGRVKIYMPQCGRRGRCSGNDLSGTAPWWLRTPGIDTDYMMIAAGNRIFPIGDKVSREKNGIRPAILVEKLDEKLFAAVE